MWLQFSEDSMGLYLTLWRSSTKPPELHSERKTEVQAASSASTSENLCRNHQQLPASCKADPSEQLEGPDAASEHVPCAASPLLATDYSVGENISHINSVVSSMGRRFTFKPLCSAAGKDLICAAFTMPASQLSPGCSRYNQPNA